MRFFNRLFIIIVLFFPLIAIGSGSPTSTFTKSFSPTDDAYVDASNENINYKNADLEVEYWDSSIGLYKQVSYLGFNVSLPTDANITEIKLKLRVKFLPFDRHTVHLLIHETTYFSEDTITYSNRPAIRVVSVASGNIVSNTPDDFVLTNYNFNALESYFLALRTDTDDVSGIAFYSKSSASYSPKLVITYNSSKVSAGSGLLVGSTLVGILLLSMIFRKKRN